MRPYGSQLGVFTCTWKHMIKSRVVLRTHIHTHHHHDHHHHHPTSRHSNPPAEALEPQSTRSVPPGVLPLDWSRTGHRQLRVKRAFAGFISCKQGCMALECMNLGKQKEYHCAASRTAQSKPASRNPGPRACKQRCPDELPQWQKVASNISGMVFWDHRSMVLLS